MEPSIDTSGDAQIMHLLNFAGCAFGASSLAFYWVDPNAEMRDFRTQGLPEEFIARYQSGMNNFDPLVIRRLAKSRRRIAWLGEEAPPLPGAPTYINFLNGYDIIDNLEFVFWNENGPFAGLGVLRNRGDPPLQKATIDVGAMQKYFEFNLLMHPRQREARVATTLARRFRLTQREIETVSLLCAGASNGEIADSLGVGLATVKTHIVNILDKFGVANRASIVSVTLSLQ
jgi:DNA-binding CsgD family transcriptional regulator